jgi:2'-5' RNA ligase
VASNLVIVAIPQHDDDVWKVSSEKKPHMTLCFLGDAMTNPNVAKISDFVERLATRSLDPFNLMVDHRGFMGPEDADVLYFAEVPWQVEMFRMDLLSNPEIRMAYEAIPQHQKWKPHLTLGYPDTPANKDDWDPMGTQYVQFDKIGVWFGDFEGPEFQLVEHPRPKEFEDSPAVAGWADQVGNVLAHHGIKGMRWGVRRKNIGGPKEVVVNVDHKKLKAKGGEGHPPTEDAVKTAAVKQKAKASGVAALSNSEIQAAVRRMNLESDFKTATTKQSAPAKKFIANLLVNTGKNQAQQAANYAASQAVSQGLKKAGLK